MNTVDSRLIEANRNVENFLNSLDQARRLTDFNGSSPFEESIPQYNARIARLTTQASDFEHVLRTVSEDEEQTRFHTFKTILTACSLYWEHTQALQDMAAFTRGNIDLRRLQAMLLVTQLQQVINTCKEQVTNAFNRAILIAAIVTPDTSEKQGLKAELGTHITCISGITKAITSIRTTLQIESQVWETFPAQHREILTRIADAMRPTLENADWYRHRLNTLKNYLDD